MDTVELLKKVRIFDNLSDDEIKTFAAITTDAKFPTGSVIFEEGSEGKALYIVRRGTVSVAKIDSGIETELVKLVVGEHFGEMSLIEHSKTSARVKSYNEVECLVISRKDFEALMDNNVAIAAKVYKNFTLALCDRLRRTSSELVVWKPDIEL
jgi:CRP/FNR family transcriptional regulator, cyclic AMP receptor protein